MQNVHVSIFIEGMYDIISENAEFDIWGKYDKKFENSVKIFHIPLAWIMRIVFKKPNESALHNDKMYKVPDIEGAQTQNFNISVSGNLNNTKNLKVKFNSLNK